MNKDNSLNRVVKFPIEYFYKGEVQCRGFVSTSVALTPTEARVFDVFRKLEGDLLKKQIAIEHMEHLASLDCDPIET